LDSHSRQRPQGLAEALAARTMHHGKGLFAPGFPIPDAAVGPERRALAGDGDYERKASQGAGVRILTAQAVAARQDFCPSYEYCSGPARGPRHNPSLRRNLATRLSPPPFAE